MAERENTEKLSEQQVYSVMEFSNALYGYLKNGVWNPYSQNSNLLNLTNAPVEATYQDLVNALSSSLSDPTSIQGYSAFMSTFDTIYRKTLTYYQGILSFDLHWSCINVKNPSEYNTQAFKDDEKRLMKFLDNFDYQREFKYKALPIILQSGVFYGWLRDSHGTINDSVDNPNIDIKRDSRYTLQIMPQNYCKITNYSEYGFLYDIDMNYFLNPNVDIQTFDPSFVSAFKKVFSESMNTDDYIPHAQYSERNGNYANWVQTSPLNGAICVKWDESTFAIIPPFANLMKATFDNTKIHELQMDKDMASAWAILYGEIGLLDKEKSGQRPDQTAFTPKTMGEFMNLVRSSLQSTMKIGALPLENTKFGQFKDSNADMESDSLNTSANQGAFAPSLIYSGNITTPNQTIVQNGIIADYNLVRPLYSQFSRILTYFVNKKTKKYKFSLEFDGSVYPFERDYRKTAIKDLSSLGVVLPPQMWASAYGYKPQTFKRALEEAHATMSDYLTPMLNVYTTKDGGTTDTIDTTQKKSGRPEKTGNEQSDEGAQDYDRNGSTGV